MKKLRLKALSLGAKEILSREQLKALTGGRSCNSALDCPIDYWCPNGECVLAGPPQGSGSGSGGGGGMPSSVSGNTGGCPTGTNPCFTHNCNFGCQTFSNCNTLIFQPGC